MSDKLIHTGAPKEELTIRRRALVHHYLCAFVGLIDQFTRTPHGRLCPKCHRTLQKKAHDWDVIGQQSDQRKP